MTYYLMNLLAVMIGSAIGGGARYGISGVVNRYLGEGFPWGTLAVNISGAFAVGVVAALLTVTGPLAGQPQAQLLLIVGIFGSYTTVSAFALQTLDLGLKGQYLVAANNIAGSFGLCLLAVWLGWNLGGVWL